MIGYNLGRILGSLRPSLKTAWAALITPWFLMFAPVDPGAAFMAAVLTLGGMLAVSLALSCVPEALKLDRKGRLAGLAFVTILGVLYIIEYAFI